MKKILLVAMLVASAFTTISAQEFSYGAKAGLNLSNFIGDEADDLDSKVGFHAGGFVELPLADKLSIQPELVFSTQGFNYEKSESFSSGTPSFKTDYKSSFQLSYLNIPVLVKYYIIEQLSVLAGPQLGVLVSAKK